VKIILFVLVLATSLFSSSAHAHTQSDGCIMPYGDHIKAYTNISTICLNVQGEFVEVATIDYGMSFVAHRSNINSNAPMLAFGVSMRPDGGLIKFFIYDGIEGALFEGDEIEAIDAKIQSWSPDSSVAIATIDRLADNQLVRSAIALKVVDGAVEYFTASDEYGGSEYSGFAWTPDSSYVAYWFDNDLGNIELGIYSSVAGTYVTITDDEYVFFRADIEFQTNGTITGEYLLETLVFSEEDGLVSREYPLPELQ